MTSFSRFAAARKSFPRKEAVAAVTTPTRMTARKAVCGEGTDLSFPRIWRRWKTGRGRGMAVPSRRCEISEWIGGAREKKRTYPLDLYR